MNQKGFIQYLLILILLIGIAVAVYLTQFTQIFKPKAFENNISFLNQSIKGVELYDQNYEDWSRDDTYNTYLNQLDKAHKTGFNMVRIWFPWHQTSNANELNDQALNHLKSFLDSAKQKNMYVLLPLTYCSHGYCGSGSYNPAARVFDSTIHQKELIYVTELAKALSTYDNLNYEFYGEHSVFIPGLREPGYEIYQQSFSNYWKQNNNDLNFLNYRWETNFSDWSQVQPPPHDVHPREGDPALPNVTNIYYKQDFYQWWASVIREKIGEEARAIRPFVNAATKIGYEDNGIINGDFMPDVNLTQAGLPIPLSNSPYDYVGWGNYPTGGDEAEEITKFNKRYQKVRQYFPNTPVFISEFGVSGNIPKQNWFIPMVINQAAGKFFGFTIWMLKDYQPLNNPSEAVFGILDINYQPKPIVNYLRNNVLRPTISSVGVSNSWNPWAIWIKGGNLSTDLIYVVRDNGSVWLDYQKIQFNAQENTGSFQLPKNNPPSNCNTQAPCSLQLVLWNPLTGLTSNPVDFSLPVSSPPPSAVKVGDLDPLAGGDGDVDLADFNMFARYYKNNDLRADFNGNGNVTLADLNMLIRNFGQ